MINNYIILPNNWLDLVEKYDIDKIQNKSAKTIAQQVKKFILDKKENIIGTRYVQIFLKAVINKNFEIYQDFRDIPEFIIIQAFSEIKGEKGLEFCKKFNSIIVELLAFQTILKEKGFEVIPKKRIIGQSDFLLKKHSLEYEAEVKFKMADQAFHSFITYLIKGKSMLDYTNNFKGKKIKINIKLSSNEIIDTIQQRIYKKVEDWCETNLSNFSDEDIDINVIETGNKDILQIQCEDNIRLSIVPKPETINNILSNHINKIKNQFKKRNPNRSIGIIVLDTSWNYDLKDKSNKIKENIKIGINQLLNDEYCCDILYVYPMGLKEILIFTQKKDN